MQNSIPSEQSTQLHEYGDNFHRFLTSFAVRSAEQIIPLLNTLLPIEIHRIICYSFRVGEVGRLSGIAGRP
jgi:hypothetical protein